MDFPQPIGPPPPPIKPVATALPLSMLPQPAVMETRPARMPLHRAPTSYLCVMTYPRVLISIHPIYLIFLIYLIYPSSLSIDGVIHPSIHPSSSSSSSSWVR